MRWVTYLLTIYLLEDALGNIYRAFFSEDAADDDLMVNIIWIAEAAIEIGASFFFIVWIFGSQTVVGRSFLLRGYQLNIAHEVFNTVARVLLAWKFQRE